MICCKIIADYNNSQGNFMQLFETLSNYGALLWDQNTLFFSETDSTKLSERKIENIVRKNGYSKCYIDIYNANNIPNESDNVKSWLLDQLMKINYVRCEQESQKMFHDISYGLDMLDLEIEKLQKEAE